jgi:oligopeptide/dipeptide ABC transporter ATP-binding protein
MDGLMERSMGRLMEMANVVDLFGAPLHPYTRGLMLSVPRIDQDISKFSNPLKEISGTVPTLIDLPPGCKFHPRCAYAFEAGVPRIVTFPTSPIFCALGSGVMDVIQYYETSNYILFKEPVGLGGSGTGSYFTDYTKFNRIVEELQKAAIRGTRRPG